MTVNFPQHDGSQGRKKISGMLEVVVIKVKVLKVEVSSRYAVIGAFMSLTAGAGTRCMSLLSSSPILMTHASVTGQVISC